MLTGHLLPESERDQDAVFEIEALSEQPEYLLLMKRLVSGTDAEFEEKRRKLSDFMADPYLRGFIESIVAAAERRSKRRQKISSAPNGLLQAAWAAVRHYPISRTFTCRDVVDAITDTEFVIVGRMPRQSVYYALRALEKDGRLTVEARGGRGRGKPNYYRVAAGVQPPLYTQEEVICHV